MNTAGKGSLELWGEQAQADVHTAFAWPKASAGREGFEQKLPLWPQPPWTGCKKSMQRFWLSAKCHCRERSSKTNLRRAAFG